MKFYMTPGSCSTGIHVLLEELGLFFEAHVVDLTANAHLKPEFLAINPRGTIPTLVLDDGSALVDFESIAFFLGAQHAKRGLLPAEGAERVRAREIMHHAIGVMHGEGYTRIFVSNRYAADPAERAAVEREGRGVVERGFVRLNQMLGHDGYVLGRFTIADAAPFYVEFWADRIGLPMPEHCQAHYERMLQRVAVRQVLGEEGYASTLRKYPLASASSPFQTHGRAR
jgi:glutathione S-transferase